MPFKFNMKLYVSLGLLLIWSHLLHAESYQRRKLEDHTDAAKKKGKETEDAMAKSDSETAAKQKAAEEALKAGVAANDALKSNVGAEDMKKAGELTISSDASEVETNQKSATEASFQDDWWFEHLGMMYYQSSPTMDLTKTPPMKDRIKLYDDTIMNENGCYSIVNLAKNKGVMYTKSEKGQWTEAFSGTSKETKKASASLAVGSLNVAAASEETVETSKSTNQDNTMSTKTSIIDAKSHRKKYIINDICMRMAPINWDFLYVFEKLPLGTNSRDQKNKYEDFLKTWGSHVITDVSIGTHYNGKVSTTDSSASSGSETKTSMCNELKVTAGVSFKSYMGFSMSASFNAAGCSNTANGNKASSSDSEQSQEYKVSGGTGKLRAQTMFFRNINNIGNLLKEASPIFNAPTDFTSIPVWDLLLRIYPETSANGIRAINLNKMYHGGGFLVGSTTCTMMNVKPLSLADWTKRSWGDNVFTKAVNGTKGEPDKPAQLTRGSSAAACKERCIMGHTSGSLNSKCKYWWFYNGDAKTSWSCYTIPRLVTPGLGKMEKFIHQADSMIGKRSCAEEIVPKCAMKQRKSAGTFIFDSADIQMIVKGAEDCQDHCANSRACNYWNYEKDHKYCELLMTLEKFIDDDVTTWFTGPKYCMHVIVDDFATRTIEDQYKIYSEEETVFDLISPSSPYTLTYPKSMCTDMWKKFEGSYTIDDCSIKCFESEDCLYFGYGVLNHRMQCYNAGFVCKFREKSEAIEFDIYKILASDISPASILKKNNLCGGQQGTPFCSTEPYDHNICNDENNHGYFAETLADCAFKCQDKYSSGIIGWSETNPYKKVSAPRGSKRCLCYEYELPMDCPSWNPPDQCKPDNPTGVADCWWDMHAVLPDSNLVVSGLTCPGLNTFVTSSRPSLGREYVEDMTSCCALCVANSECEFAVMEKETNYCYKLPAPASSVTQRTGWVTCPRRGCREIEKIEKVTNFDAMWYDEHVFV